MTTSLCVAAICGSSASTNSRRLGDRLVHLPVGGDVRACGSGIVVSASTPGSFFPSSSSSDAPPPVESQSTLSARPNCCSAATESPPPTTVVPGRGRDRLGDGAGAGGERLQLEGAHRAVPEHGAGGGDRLGVGARRCAGRCRGPSSRRAPRRRRSRARSVAASKRSPSTRSTGRRSSQSEPSACSSASRGQLDALLLDQRVAGRDPLGAEEAEAHRAADQDLVGDLEEAVDHADLVGDLGAAEDDDQRPRRRLDHARSARSPRARAAARRRPAAARRPPRWWRGRGGRRRRRR